MIVTAWNVRGMNSPVKAKEVRDFLDVNNISSWVDGNKN